MRCEISTHEETIEQLQDRIQTIQNDYSRELMQLEAKHRSELNRKETEHAQETTRLRNWIAWQGHIIGCLSFLLLKTSDIFRKAVHSIIRFARDYYKPRLIRNRYLTSRTPLTCSEMTDNHIRRQGISYTSQPDKG